jgi:ribonuclease HI
MNTGEKDVVTVDSNESGPLTFFVDGAGCRPDGTGSGFAWLCKTTNEKGIERVPALTNNQAEYRALIAALTVVPSNTRLEVFSDSLLLCCQFSGEYAVNDPDLAELLAQAQSLIKEKSLSVTLQWVPRARNLAGKLLVQR